MGATLKAVLLDGFLLISLLDGGRGVPNVALAGIVTGAAGQNVTTVPADGSDTKGKPLSYSSCPLEYTPNNHPVKKNL